MRLARKTIDARVRKGVQLTIGHGDALPGQRFDLHDLHRLSDHGRRPSRQ